jgi:hypothetical protein
LVLAVCAQPQPTPTQVHCPPDCRLAVTLPAEVDAPPEISREEFRVSAGTAVQFDVIGRPGAQPPEAVTILKFSEPAFVRQVGHGQQAKPVYTIVLPVRGPGYEARSNLDCPEDGCWFKYDIINKGNENRPPRDPWIIIH